LRKDVGFVSLALLYLAFGLGSPLAPSVASLFSSPRPALSGCVTVYLVWIVTSAYPYAELFLTMSFIMGLTASLVWNLQGRMHVSSSMNSFLLRRIIIAFYSGRYMTAVAHEAGVQHSGYLTGMTNAVLNKSTYVSSRKMFDLSIKQLHTIVAVQICVCFFTKSNCLYFVVFNIQVCSSPCSGRPVCLAISFRWLYSQLSKLGIFYV
jgi:hypothetical protein